MTNISRRSVVKGAAWTAPAVAVATQAPALAASPIGTDILFRADTPQPNNQAAKTVIYVVGNEGPLAVTSDMGLTYTLTVEQTAGRTDANAAWFRSSDPDRGAFFTLSDPQTTTNTAGYKVTTQTLTLADFPADDFFRLNIRFPGSAINRAAWTVTATPNFQDINPGNTTMVDLE